MEPDFAFAVRKSDHLRNRTSVKIFPHTRTVSQVVTFPYRERKSGFSNGPKSGNSTGNVSPNATPEIRTNERTDERTNGRTEKPRIRIRPPSMRAQEGNMRRSVVGGRCPPRPSLQQRSTGGLRGVLIMKAYPLRRTAQRQRMPLTASAICHPSSSP